MNGQSAGKSFAYILGVYFGDGCITNERKRKVFRLEVMDEDFALEFVKQLESLKAHNKFYKIENSRYIQGYSYIVVCRQYDLINTLLEDTNNKTTIPDYVYKWNKENKLAFIAGLMDSEGFVSQRTKIMKNGLPSFQMGIKMDFNILKQFKKILQSVGIKTGKFSLTKTIVNIQTANLSININSWIDSGAYFNIQRKNKKVQEYYSNTNLNEYTLGTAI